MHVQGKVAIITGAASGFGKALAKRLVNKGAKVLLADIDVNGGEKLAAELNGSGSKSKKVAHFVRCDVTSIQDLSSLFPEALKHFHRFDIMINNSGIMEKTHLFADDHRYWHKVLAVDLVAVIEGTRLAIDAFKVEKRAGRLEQGGAIVNTASIVGLYPFPQAPVYTAAKFGVVGFTRCFKRELHEKSTSYLAESGRGHNDGTHSAYEAVHEMGIRVNAVGPTWADTGLITDIREMATGMMPLVSVDLVVDAFMLLIEDDSLSGDVATIRPEKGSRD
ncbi:hypothetical protein BGZ70_007303 [Mortierella alpina]|uniref:Uncharacterized protein n=1 Tax=Mortierella alpina TaxID=64518 RepID=A0A9P6J6W0_MORAP|nr:hypothetical protein BGZ70_007303 [Mortierella alpina]